MPKARSTIGCVKDKQIRWDITLKTDKISYLQNISKLTLELDTQ